MLEYGGSVVDEAIGHNDAFFMRQQQQHDNYGAPLTYSRTAAFTVKRAEQSDAQRRLIMGELERLRRQRSQELFNAKAAAAPVIPQLEDLLQNVKAEDRKSDVLPPPQKTRRDFFGRIVPVDPPSATTPQKPSSSGSSTAASTAHVSPQYVRYKYQEGFTNAIKRKLTLSYFL